MPYQGDSGDEDDWADADPPPRPPANPVRQDDAITSAEQTWALILASLTATARRQEEAIWREVERSLGMRL